MTQNRSRKAGHRKWGRAGQKVPGKHNGDIMSTEKRSRVMAKIQGKNTSPELIMERELRALDLNFERHSKDLTGKPDFVFRDAKVAVFVDGDFWHGFRFPLWSHKLSPKWREKIAATRVRDRKNFSALRRHGWKVLRNMGTSGGASAAECVKRVKIVVKLHAPVEV